MINGGCTGSGGRRALAGLLAVIAQPLAQQAGIDVMLLRDVRQRFPGLQALGGDLGLEGPGEAATCPAGWQCGVGEYGEPPL